MNEKLTILIRKYFDQTGSEQDTGQLMAMLRQSENDEQLKLLLEREWSAFREAHPYFSPEETRDMLDGILENGRQNRAGVPVRRISFQRRWWVAASVLIILGAGIYYLFTGKGRHPGVPVSASQQVLPGKSGAVLVLADGTQVLLDTIQNGKIALQGGALVKVTNGELHYEGKGTEVLYNTMITPQGRQFNLVLPDGTKVWLNAASSIRYPVAFSGKMRVVQLTGEGYFEVAKNAAMPFRVNVNNKTGIDVLGTHFNVNAYENENNIAATLLEGSVAVGDLPPTGADNRNIVRSVVLKPGQQAQIAHDAVIKIVNNANLEKVLAWKNGLFYFDGATLEEVMRQITRWYDVKVIYTGNVQELFYGSIPMNLELYKVLQMLEKTKSVQFQIKNDRIIVSKMINY